MKSESIKEVKVNFADETIKVANTVIEEVERGPAMDVKHNVDNYVEPTAAVDEK